MCRPKLKGDSPWGSIQQIDPIDKDNWELLFISTAGHGGLWIGPTLRARFRKMFPEFQGYAGFPWLEEDCDICLGVIAFPEFFNADQLQQAIQTVRAMKDYFVSANEALDKMLVA